MEAAPAERETPADWGDGAVSLSFRVKAFSRESASQKASNVLEPDLRSHWSTGTNTKEWILLELQEPCLLSHVRIYNKSVLEWELTAGLRYKPDAFFKVRPRCEAPKRDMVYPGNHTPCRYVRISCLRGNPIAIFFIQLIGIPVPGLEPEFQPLVNHLLPPITSSKQPPSQNVHLQVLSPLPLQTDLNSIADNPESSVRFLALLAGPFYPIIYLINERDPSKTSISSADSDPLRTSVAAIPTVSSNFEACGSACLCLSHSKLFHFVQAQPRRSRSPSSVQPSSYLLAFRSETSVLLLRKALKDKNLGMVCHRASKVLQKLLQPEPFLDKSISNGGMLSSHNGDEITKSDSPSLLLSTDYSSLFGEEFSISENQFDDSYLNILDIAAVEEGILHVLYAAASQPLLCHKLAETTSDMWSVLPLVQALLPALRPPLSPGLTEQIDDSFNQWNHPTVQTALSQIDFAVELVEYLLCIIQEAGRSLARSRAALKYFVLAISGHMDDVLTEYKLRGLLFSLLWNLNGDEELLPQGCVILSILDPHMPLPPDIDLCKSTVNETAHESLAVSDYPAPQSSNPENIDGHDTSGTIIRAESFEQCNSLFAPEELKQSELMRLTLNGNGHDGTTQTSLNQEMPENRPSNEKLSSNPFQLDNITAADYFDAQADYQQLMNHQDCKLRAHEFQRLALNLCMQQEPTLEGHNAGIDALLLAAECYVNPFFLLDFRLNSEPLKKIERIHSELMQGNVSFEPKDLRLKDLDPVTIYNLENKRDKSVIDLLLQAARFDCEYHKKGPEWEPYPDTSEDDKQSVNISAEALQSADAEHLLSANRVSYLRGNVAANAKAVVLYLLESIVVEHVEAIIPEMPRIVHILVSLCRASYTDVDFLNYVLCLVKPLISYYLKNRADDKKVLGHATECSDFEFLCFEELFEIIQCDKLSDDTTGDKIQSILQEDLISSSSEQDVAMNISCELAQKHWESALDGLIEIILLNQETQCWQVASAMLDYIIKIPSILTWGKVLNSICSAVKNFCTHAPRISWRLQTEKWLPLLVCGKIEDFKNEEICLIDLFCIMLSHSEPEQRSVALQQLGRIVNSTSHAEADSKSSTCDQNVIRYDSKVAAFLATHTWDRVVALALHDSSMLLRNHAMALLIEYVPFVDTKHLQSFLGSSNNILNSAGPLSGVIEEGYMTRMSLLLLSKACLYSAPEDIALIPESVWRKLERMQTSTGGFSYMEKELCQALCQLRNESDAKTDLKEVLSGCTRKPMSSDFKSIRESILQVLSSLSSVDAFFEFFSARSDQENQEREEAEIELELIEKEEADRDLAGHPHDTVVPDMPPYHKDDKRLQEIRENIRSLERSRLKEEITARRQKKLLIRHARENRSRERYRERDGGRSQQEGSLRSSSRGHEGGGSTQTVAPAGGPGSTVVLAGSRTFSGGNLPTILQPRERNADEDSAWGDGSRDSGDASSIGDAEFDGARQHGPRSSGSKSSSSSRQLVERREREGAAGAARREGKWERKQHS
ncbi:hypothetical protein PR202_ga07996 [Eleusine coracana subsp. coracana]|uniref:DNA-repair protein Xrcc1 N-terminal domain-containing protein n=1 Tax=Eleusine coracana subsp. coracana TaxID=191504 RepID=A0AAV5BZ72_ELECO|nr:hypothetical protein PR202_ga07996 [Eleusine coracana subsp. coracana]